MAEGQDDASRFTSGHRRSGGRGIEAQGLLDENVLARRGGRLDLAQMLAMWCSQHDSLDARITEDQCVIIGHREAMTVRERGRIFRCSRHGASETDSLALGVAIMEDCIN